MRWSKVTTRTLVKLCVFAAVCIVLAGALAVRIGNVHLFSNNVAYQAQLTNASDLISGDAVKISGVTVGRVDSVGVDHGHAVVHFDLQPNVHVRSSTGVGLQWLDVIGQKVMYLYPGTTGSVLRPGGVLPLSNDVGDASVGALLNTLGPFLQAINPKEQNLFLQAISGALQGDNAEVHQLLDHTASVSSTVGSLSSQLGSLIDNLSTVVSAISAHRGDVALLTQHLAGLSSTLAAHNGLIDTTVSNLGAAEKDFASMLARNGTSLDSVISNLKGIAQNLDSHKNALALSLHTLPAGLAPYEQISSYGQWFEIDPVFTCIANQTKCSYQQPTNPPGGSSSPAPNPPSGLSGPGGGTASSGGGLPTFFNTIAGGS